MYGRHYKHPKEFSEKKFKQWSKNAIELKKSYDDSQIDKFRIELRKLYDLYSKNRTENFCSIFLYKYAF